MCQSGCAKNGKFKMAKIKVEDAVGTRLAHDITEIRPKRFKGPAFRRGHRVMERDICRLMKLGKRHLYVIDLDPDHVHEDDAVGELAAALAGPGVDFGATPSEGKLQLHAAYDGLLKIATEALVDFNMIPDVMCAGLHSDIPVQKGQCIAGTRAIPLIIRRQVLDQALALARKHYPIFGVKAFNSVKASLLITGNEVFEGLIEDKFQEIVAEKLAGYGATLMETSIVPDDVNIIAQKVRQYLENGAELIISTGGMSVDPDDVTRAGIEAAGADRFHYGAAVLPGAMFLLAYLGEIPIMGIPACALHHKATAFDLVLPRLLAGETVDDRDLARLAVGGLCLDCPTCRFPGCGFGK